MADTHDTIKGLLAEFHGYAAGMPDSYHVTMSWADFRKMLTRFEWAHRRERGDCAKLREALNVILGKFFENGYGQNRAELDDNDKQMILAALAAPPRNCDVGTPEEQAKRLNAFCDSHGHGFDGQKCYSCENCQFISIDRCELAWAQLPYESEAAR